MPKPCSIATFHSRVYGNLRFGSNAVSVPWLAFGGTIWSGAAAAELRGNVKPPLGHAGLEGLKHNLIALKGYPA